MAVKCPKCQADNREGAKFCQQCATELARRCPNCGAQVEQRARFCDQCAHDLTETKPTPPVDYSKPQAYTPKFLADKILTTRRSIEGERKLVTVLFADVANYTAMSEKLDPEEVHQIMDGCFKILMDETHRYEGTIDKFTGDGVMALFGAPLAHEDHAQRACYAALGIQKAIGEYGEKVKKDCGVDFKMRVGLNSGPVIVGAVGNDLRMDYTAVGDTVNLASRMQSLAKPGAVLVSRDVHKTTRDFFRFKPLGKLAVKGKEEPIEAYELLEATAVATRIEAAVIRGLTRFVGREKEMATLKEAFEKAKSGSGQVVGIVGEAGVGKSRLLLELRRTLAEGECAYLEGHCLHYGGAMAYLPILDILRSYFDIEEGEKEFLIRRRLQEKIVSLDPEFKAILPPLQELLSLKVEDEAYLKLEPQKKRERIFEAIRDLLMVESQQRPLMVAIEDLHWIDRTSEEFLSYLIGHLTSSHILLLLLYRPEYTHQWGSKSCYSQVRVDELPTKSSAELVRAMLEKGEVAPELRELILNRAAGNPLFMEEFTHTLLENGSIGKKDRQYVLTRKASEIQVPDTIQGIVAARMDRLDENLKRTMQVASVIGRDFAYRILHTITGMKEELKSYLVNLQGLEFIYEKSLFPELEYVFKHALTQEVAYNSLLLKRRKEIHDRIGKAIEELYPDRLEEFYEILAHHYLMGENWEKAYGYIKMSAEKAMLNHSTWEAFRLGKEAIAALGKLPQTEENKRRDIEVRLLMTSPMLGLVFPEDSLEILQVGERLAGDLGDHWSRAKFRRSLGAYYVLKEDPSLGMTYCESAFDDADRVQDLNLMASMGVELQFAYQRTGEYRKYPKLAKIVELIERTGKESENFGMPYHPYPMLVSAYGVFMAMTGRFHEGAALCQKALRFAHATDDLVSLAGAELSYGSVLCHRGDGRGGLPHIEKAIHFFGGAQILVMVPQAWYYLSLAHTLLGDHHTALKDLKMGLDIQQKSGQVLFKSTLHQMSGRAYLELGEFDEAWTSLNDGLKVSRTDKERSVEGRILIYLGTVQYKLAASEANQAEDLIRQGISILEDLELKPLYSIGHLHLGELYADMGSKQQAVETLNKAKAAFQEMGMDYYLARTEKALEKLKAA